MTLPRFISLSEAAERLRTTERDVRTLIQSGKLDGGILPDGETMVVNEDNLPQRKEDLPEYRKHTHLKGIGIWASEAERKYNIPNQTFVRWANNGIISTLGWDGNKRLLDEADVAYCAEIYRRQGGQGKRLFNSDGTPYTPKSIAG